VDIKLQRLMNFYMKELEGPKLKYHKLSKSLLHEDSRIIDAIHTLNTNANKIVLVVDSSGVLKGTITDGDIRRGLLSGMGMESKIKQIIHTSAVSVLENYQEDSVLQLMIDRKIEQIPVLNSQGIPVDLLVWNEIRRDQILLNRVFIMAGGRGQRLLPLTKNCPKPMLLVSGKPILEHIILKAKKEGFRNFTISIHYLGEIISNYFGDGSRFGVNINYVEEDKPLGTAGSLSLLPVIPAEPIIVINGDILSENSLKHLLDFHSEKKSFATMAVREHVWENPYGVVEIMDNQIMSYTEKPTSISKINAGIYVLEPEAFSYLIAGEPCNMPDFFLKLMSNNKRVLACPVREQWVDLGNHSDLEKASEPGSVS
jgi:dTDP-glucose pyrophosphorylase